MPRRPLVVLHNAVSMDGSTAGAPVDIGLFYRAAASIGAGAMLVGSRTATAGITMFGGNVPAEGPADFRPPPERRCDRRPCWFIVDSRGALRGSLHVLRRSGLCRDVVIVVSRSTPRRYIEHLRRRGYGYITAGTRRVDLRRALERIALRYGVKTVQVDSGGRLAGILLQQGLADRISLVVSPTIVGKDATPLFRDMVPRHVVPLRLLSHRRLDRGHLHLMYAVAGTRSKDRLRTSPVRSHG
ncbi:RibD family protein [bacterium]|nr:RibD family protein [bacterium]